jgi:ADP-ribose pyrophosphatase
MDLKEHLVRGEEVFAGRLLRVRRDVVRLPDGSESVREYIRHPGAVAVVALFDDDRVLLERQFRYPHGREFIELPAGSSSRASRTPRPPAASCSRRRATSPPAGRASG